MSRTRNRVERINETVPIARVLSDYGYQVHEGGDREQQFPCDLHGDGQDGKPSARAYPESNSWYCFACGKSRDAIETTRIKENLGFMEALAFLEQKYGLPTLPWEDEGPQPSRPNFAVEVAQHLEVKQTFPEARLRLATLLDGETRGQYLPMDTLLTFWEALDKVAWQVEKGEIPEHIGRQVVGKLHDRLLGVITNAH